MVVRFFSIIFFLLASFSIEKSYAVPNFYSFINGIEIKPRDIYQLDGSNLSNVEFSNDGNILFHKKKAVPFGVKNVDKYFASYKNIWLWPTSFSPSKKFVLFIANYKQANSSAFLINTNDLVIYNAG